MKLTGFDHINIRTANLAAMVEWYDRVLGMTSGKRPEFTFSGAWLYLGGQALIHLVGVEGEPASVEPKIEHFAIRAEGLKAFLAHLNAEGVEARLAEIPDFGITQVNIHDPDGNHIHIDFVADADPVG
ncbi:MAG: VOC family protein [Paracoccaceae bacterium]